MGGHALSRAARRLSTPELEHLTRHCLSGLESHIFPVVLPLKALPEKTSHGDLDLICAYDERLDSKKIKGEDWGVFVDGNDMGVGEHHPVQGVAVSPTSPEGKAEKDGKEGEENARFRAWVVSVAKAIGGSEWKRSGTNGVVISIGVPCGGVEGIDIGPKGDQELYEVSTRDQYGSPLRSLMLTRLLPFVTLLFHSPAVDPTKRRWAILPQPFFQVDLQLCPARSVEFTRFIRSYSNTLLSHAVDYISPHLSLLNTHLGLRYSPYFGLEPIRMEITSCPEELCDWLGVDYAKMERGLETEKDLWRWATEVREGGAIDAVWKIVADRGKRGDKGTPRRKGKDEGWVRFVQWLRTDKESPYNMESGDPARLTGSVNQVSDATTLNPPNSTSTADANSSREPVLEGGTVTLVPTPAQIKVNEDLLDAERPKPLHYKAQDVLERFGKMDELSELLNERKMAAVVMANRRRLKAETPSVLPSDAVKVLQTLSVERVIAGSLGELAEHLRGMEAVPK